MTEDQLVEATFDREGVTYGDAHTTPPIDQPTAAGGITLGCLRDYVRATGAALPVHVDTLKALTKDTAAPIVRWKLRELARANKFDHIPHEALRNQMIDWAYNSGPGLAIRWLQRVLGVPRTGVMDLVTLVAVRYPDHTRIPVWLSESLLAARLRMIDMATDPGGRVDHQYEEGLENRALTFSLLEVP